MSKARTSTSTSRVWRCVFTTRSPIYWANAADGVLEQNPMVGQFSDGRGEFYNQQVYEGRAIYARFVWSGVTTNSPHFEQSFSADGGKTGETNWITDQTREKP